MDRLSMPKVTKDIVQKYGFKFSKSLGQNFLVDSNVLLKIVDGANIEEGDCVIEVGPGIGTLTRELSKRAEKVVAIEIDKNLIPILQETLSDRENVEIINEDILKLDIKKLMEDKFQGKRVKVVANLPYYITTPIIMRFLEENIPVKTIVVMIQKEVAHRMNAQPSTKDYGALSVAIQFYCETSIVANVPKTVFMPQPNVDSTVIRLDLLDEPPCSVKDRDMFFRVVKASFSKRRKTLLNCISSSELGISKDDSSVVIKSAGIDEKRRGETLTIQEFAALSNSVYDFLESARP
ncbi:MAG: 16S rRNA (adenine(1518)-N(6)/adenine(1519)-N(6))-dimethyltransferase RsmA [Peptoclostridium sp.]|uniref:16S rRNA (adenine(1518)-N(6)/adenine(1519)-N(6))- dimethyltransferase RsmA n=1 Tax=Peptoclostridium sp. TaxID=1904860 RepID=UPI00139D3F19|nr:16S rRNA (adenine(1518)-N(6)/adenine(1519)-N(6))-dimethyltransferase RsmA [Peptoclostridium sp.]MZQ74822.1 16S rRNA (adenine(1518)-N(6)/adenine(1519)-N(6))-dimethyltransferase RsmA [Peptoclostridium sp.]